MQRKQLKNLKRNTDKTKKIWQNKNEKKEYLRGENCQGDSWQENFLGGQTKDMTKNIGADWREIEDDGRANDQEKGKRWRRSKRKKKLSKKTQD